MLGQVAAVLAAAVLAAAVLAAAEMPPELVPMSRIAVPPMSWQQ